MDQLETIIYNRKEDLTSISTKNSIILAEKSKLISERDSLVIARTSVLTEAEFDDIFGRLIDDGDYRRALGNGIKSTAKPQATSDIVDHIKYALSSGVISKPFQ